MTLAKKCKPWAWLLLSLASASAMTVQAAGYELLVGSYTQGASQGIYRFAFDSLTGRIDPQPLQVVKAANPSWLTVSADQRLLFAVNENGPGQADTVGRVSSFSIDPKTLQLAAINQVPSQGDEPTHSSLSKDGRFLFVANYAVHSDPGGSLAVIPVGEGGTLGPVVQLERHKASEVDPQRQSSSHVHSVVSSPDGQFVFASDLGADKLFVYRYDPSTPKHPLRAGKPAAVEVPGGSGPRHLWFGAGGKYAYLTLELTSRVVVFALEDGTLKPQQILELADGLPLQDNAAGAVHGSADGKFLYVSNRGKANQLVVYAIDPANGLLTDVQKRSVEGDHPREFSLDPSGRFLLIANQKSNEVVVLRRDPESGLLGDVVQKLPLDSPSDVKFLRRP